MRRVGFALAAVGIALTFTGILPMAAAALLERLLEPLGGWGLAIELAAFVALSFMLIEAVTR